MGSIGSFVAGRMSEGVVLMICVYVTHIDLVGGPMREDSVPTAFVKCSLSALLGTQLLKGPKRALRDRAELQIVTQGDFNLKEDIPHRAP